MNQPNSVPQLNLAPQLNRPLSLWNPLDYLLFLYWIFFFPQALRWYEEQYLMDNKSNQIKLWIQGLILTAVIPISICKLLEAIGYSINWSQVYFGIVLGVVTIIIVQQTYCRDECNRIWIVYGVAWSIVYGGLLSIAYGLLPDSGWNGFWVWLYLGFFLGIFLGVFLIFILEVWFGWGLDLAYTLPQSVSAAINGLKSCAVAITLLLIIVPITKTDGIAYSIILLIILINLGFLVMILRPENWLIGSLLNGYKTQNKSFLFPRITPIPLPLLTSRLTSWLRQDWLLGLKNANELLRYSHQFIPVVNAVNQVLHETPPEHLIFRISQLATNPADWQLVKYVSVSLSKQLQTRGITEDIRLDTPPHATAAGFWYLYNHELDKAMEAFDVVRTLIYGEEMFILVQTIRQLQDTTYYSRFDYQFKENNHNDNNSKSRKKAITLKKLKKIAAVKLPTFPSKPLLCPTTWEVLNSLRSVIQDIQFIIGETSQSTHNTILNRTINKLQIVLDNSDTIPEAERIFIVSITQNWKETLEENI
jgi:hypothetical protein